MKKTNPSGNTKYDNEKELCQLLERYFFPTFFDQPWVPQEGMTKEVWISKHDRIDYRGLKNGSHTYVEVKNWFVTKGEVAQVAGYKTLLPDKPVYLICGGIEPRRREALESMDVVVLLTRELHFPGDGELAQWM